MQKLEVFGANKLKGQIKISGSKNASLPILAATLLSNKKIKDVENQITLNNFPIDIIKLIESINVKFLKKKYSQQSEIDLGVYKLNLNSRKIFNNENSLDLTEREANIIFFLNNSKSLRAYNLDQTETSPSSALHNHERLPAPKPRSEMHQNHEDYLAFQRS